MRFSDVPIDPTTLPAAPGSYVLELDLVETITLVVGRLGRLRLGPGRMRYYGSARGPGGIRARVARHLRRVKRRHWHIDALTSRVPVARLAFSLVDDECSLVRRDLESGRWQVAAAGFGSSDCRSCPAHLLVENPTVARVTPIDNSPSGCSRR